MNTKPTRFNIMRQFFRDVAIAKLDNLIRLAAPQEKFRFYTFEGNDYSDGKLTLLVFEFVPERILLTIPAGFSIKTVLDEVTLLNEGVLFETAPVPNYGSANDGSKNRVFSLTILTGNMKIDPSGRLII